MKDEDWSDIFYRKIYKKKDEYKFKVLLPEDMSRINFPLQNLMF